MEEEQTLRMRNLHRAIIKGIEGRSSLTEEDLRNLDIEQIEKIIDVKVVNPKKTPIVFEWELQERLGWQLLDLDFISEKEYEKREKDIDSAMRNL